MKNIKQKLSQPINCAISSLEHSNILTSAYESQQFRKVFHAIIENWLLRVPYALEIGLWKRTCRLCSLQTKRFCDFMKHLQLLLHQGALKGSAQLSKRGVYAHGFDRDVIITTFTTVCDI